jgi:hypothetical protein
MTENENESLLLRLVKIIRHKISVKVIVVMLIIAGGYALKWTYRHVISDKDKPSRVSQLKKQKEISTDQSSGNIVINPKPVFLNESTEPVKILLPLQERLLELLAKYQKRFEGSKLVVSLDDGMLRFDNDETKGSVNLIKEIYGSVSSQNVAHFKDLVSSMPKTFFRYSTATPKGPYVVRITQAGIKHLRLFR